MATAWHQAFPEDREVHIGSASQERKERRWPNYQRCVQGAPENRDKTGPDVSRADFTWCMTAIDWGFSIEDTAKQLKLESAKAKENGERYALLTAQNAAAAVERRQRSRA